MAKAQETKVSSIVPQVSKLGEIYSDQGRYFFNDDRTILELPGLIEVQLDSYDDFLKTKLDKAFNEVFPIEDFSGEKIAVYYKGYSLEEPKYSVSDCKRKNLNYEAPLKARFEMLNKQSGEIKEQDVYLGGITTVTLPSSIEIVSGTASVSAKEQKRVANFVIKVRLVRASEAEKIAAKMAADAASSPVSPASTPVPAKQ